MQADIGGGQICLAQGGIDRWQIGLMHMGQDHVLLVADAQLVMAIGLGQIGHHAHLVRGCIARRRAVLLELIDTIA